MASTDENCPLSSTVISSDRAVVTCMKATLRNVLLGLDNGTVSILDLDGKNERKLRASKMGVWCLDIWDDGRDEFVAVGGVDSVVGIWNVGTL